MYWQLDLPAARYCRDVYEDAERLVKDSIGGVVHVEGAEYGGDAFVFETEDYNWVVFRGIDIWTGEFWKDAKVALKAYWKRVNGDEGRRLKLHGGFFKTWQEISAEVTEEIMNRRMEQKFEDGHEKPTIYCGHSAGGALAGIAAATHRPFALITFGAPRFSGKALGEYLGYCEHNHRWVNGGDWVPKVPFGFGYRHHGVEKFISATGEVVENVSWFRRNWEFVAHLTATAIKHSMPAYVFALMASAFDDVMQDLNEYRERKEGSNDG